MVATTPTASKSGISGNQVYSTLNFGGNSSWSNTVYIDGVDAGAGPQGAVATPGLEALQETQVQTTNADAELGATGGGVLLFELKSGMNKIHGSAFEFLQNEALNANSWSNNYFSPAAPWVMQRVSAITQNRETGSTITAAASAVPSGRTIPSCLGITNTTARPIIHSTQLGDRAHSQNADRRL